MRISNQCIWEGIDVGEKLSSIKLKEKSGKQSRKLIGELVIYMLIGYLLLSYLECEFSGLFVLFRMTQLLFEHICFRHVLHKIQRIMSSTMFNYC